jgi:hypothetical protein
VWHGFFFVNCNKLPNIESPGIATRKSSKPKHCNSYYIKNVWYKICWPSVCRHTLYVFLPYILLLSLYYYFLSQHFQLKFCNWNVMFEIICKWQLSKSSERTLKDHTIDAHIEKGFSSWKVEERRRWNRQRRSKP